MPTDRIHQVICVHSPNFGPAIPPCKSQNNLVFNLRRLSRRPVKGRCIINPAHASYVPVDRPDPLGSAWRRRLLIFAAWTFLGLFYAIRLYVLYVTEEGVRLISWQQSVIWGLADWYLWGLLSLLIYRLCARVPIDTRRWPLAVVIHLVASAIFSTVQLALFTLAFRPLGSFFYHRVATTPKNVWELYQGMFAGKIHIAVLTYFLIAMVSYAIQFYRNYRAEQQRRAGMEAKLARAQLDALKMQLHPHFLFNTLNSITALIHTDPDAADRMTARLGELLRITLDNEGIHEVPVATELDFTRKYLDIQQLRFQDRLTIQVDAAADTNDALVPNLLLQPLVENAIRHGISEQAGPGQIGIAVQRDGATLRIDVTDTGPGLGKQMSDDSSSGVGLSNTRERLAQLYGDRQRLELIERPEGGVCVRIELPYHVAEGRDSSQ